MQTYIRDFDGAVMCEYAPRRYVNQKAGIAYGLIKEEDAKAALAAARKKRVVADPAK